MYQIIKKHILLLINKFFSLKHQSIFPFYYFGLSSISAVFPVIRVFQVNLGTENKPVQT